MEEKLQQLRSRLAQVDDLGRAAAVLEWDHQTYMPPAADALTSAAGQVSSTSLSLSQSASEQAASVEETTASLQQMALR